MIPMTAMTKTHVGMRPPPELCFGEDDDPDELLDEWHAYKEHIPLKWINSYDKGTVIRNKNLYDLKAIPALYLLDAEKRVIVKDSTEVGFIEYMIANIEGLVPNN